VADELGGFVCPAGDRAAFVRATVSLLQRPTLRKQFGEFNAARIRGGYSWDRCAARVTEIYADVLREWRRRTRR
jgi:glycosyltransferase involved in cell wall biosynthesis